MSGRKKCPILHRTTSEKMVPTDDDLKIQTCKTTSYIHQVNIRITNNGQFFFKKSTYTFNGYQTFVR